MINIGPFCVLLTFLTSPVNKEESRVRALVLRFCPVSNTAVLLKMEDYCLATKFQEKLGYFFFFFAAVLGIQHHAETYFRNLTGNSSVSITVKLSWGNLCFFQATLPSKSLANPPHFLRP